jgi:hypothetical protein
MLTTTSGWPKFGDPQPEPAAPDQATDARMQAQRTNAAFARLLEAYRIFLKAKVTCSSTASVGATFCFSCWTEAIGPPRRQFSARIAPKWDARSPLFPLRAACARGLIYGRWS